MIKKIVAASVMSSFLLGLPVFAMTKNAAPTAKKAVSAKSAPATAPAAAVTSAPAEKSAKAAPAKKGTTTPKKKAFFSKLKKK